MQQFRLPWMRADADYDDIGSVPADRACDIEGCGCKAGCVLSDAYAIEVKYCTELSFIHLQQRHLARRRRLKSFAIPEVVARLMRDATDVAEFVIIRLRVPSLVHEVREELAALVLVNIRKRRHRGVGQSRHGRSMPVALRHRLRSNAIFDIPLPVKRNDGPVLRLLRCRRSQRNASHTYTAEEKTIRGQEIHSRPFQEIRRRTIAMNGQTHGSKEGQSSA